MASDDPPKEPAKRIERRDKTNRIAEISHRIADIGNAISVAVRGVGDQIFTLRNQIQTDNKTTDAHEKEYQDRSFRWMKWGTQSSIVLSFFSLLSSVGALYVVNRQLDTMRIEQRAWITIETVEHAATKIEVNKPFFTRAC